uniref:saxitoxin and tetrodotoxin-binding protein 1-like n=1 Tax=Epinephelus lanceolatus TaxID=310571 RepID=UPI001447F589|nr:saxitoxin and tetrodotoxin-binding protein 1-like [Epinephelus lanceolatus]
MSVLPRAFLLVMMVLSASAAPVAENCSLPEKVKRQELHKVLEVRWVLVEAFSDYPTGVELLTNATSSLLELRDANETIRFIERNKAFGKCLIFRGNMSLPDPETSNHTLHLKSATQDFNGQVSPYDDQGRVDIYQGCPDCVLIIYSGVFEGTPGKMLLIYRREGKHLDAKELKDAQSIHRKVAECLKFNMSSQFTYDGKAGFCLEKTE